MSPTSAKCTSFDLRAPHRLSVTGASHVESFLVPINLPVKKDGTMYGRQVRNQPASSDSMKVIPPLRSSPWRATAAVLMAAPCSKDGMAAHLGMLWLK